MRRIWWKKGSRSQFGVNKGMNEKIKTWRWLVKTVLLRSFTVKRRRMMRVNEAERDVLLFITSFIYCLNVGIVFPGVFFFKKTFLF